ncbi:MAG: ABC transporter ATP-binding protein [Armatimonadetes bacterium]|nr:ABC transporter ATP-binding protein [Armatimonadota bacterium]
MLDLVNLTKRYHDLTAVDHLNLHLAPGEIFGFIGPNGAGKTTTIKMLATLLRPTEGDALVDGVSVVAKPEQVRSLIGYMPDNFGVYDDVKVWEYLDFFASAYRIPREQRSSLIGDVLALTDLRIKRDAFVEELSRGMKQRLCLAKTLLHDPPLLLLDEPASGLDPRARIEMRELLKQLRRTGKTILISSHILSELADFCTTVGIIEAGRLVASGSVEEIIQQTGLTRTLELRITAGLERVETVLREVEMVRDVVVDADAGTCAVSFAGELDDVADLLKMLLDDGVRVVQAMESASDLEGLFMRVTRGQVA